MNEITATWRTPERLAELEALAKAAVHGPWQAQVVDGDHEWEVVYTTPDDHPIIPGETCAVASYLNNTDAAFVAAARTAVPELLEAVQELERQYAELRDVVQEHRQVSAALLSRRENERDALQTQLSGVRELANQHWDWKAGQTLAHKLRATLNGLCEPPPGLHSCHCVDVEIGSYANQVSMKCPYINDDRDGWVCIDTCIATEIGWLWHQGVHTLNSCCGHGKHRASVIVNIEHETLMESLGYDDWDLSHTGHHRIYRLRTGTQVPA